ncbi:MAG: cytochrome c3 family protein [Candidatus Pacebacteria bacterium]|nr:cytochrome c3 family protein [Candidatus Paceibacterota bacterium]
MKLWIKLGEQEEHKMKRIAIWASLVVLFMIGLGSPCIADSVGGCTGCHQEIVDNFETSLHYTASGMYDGYQDGAAGYFGIDMDEYYEEFNCAKCHVTTCTTCHIGYSATYGHKHQGNQINISIDTCDPCHGKKQTSTFMGEMPMHKSKGPSADIHYEAGMICTDCHEPEDMHGTGVKYDKQLEAISVECGDCHNNPEKTVNEIEVTQYSSESYSHEIHGDNLSCITCHSSWVLNCQNCHLKDRKGMTVTPDTFFLAKDEEGQITTFFKMETKYQDESHIETEYRRDEIHTVFGEWYGHTATNEPKKCNVCHENAEEVFLARYTVGENVQICGSFVDNKTIERVINAEIVQPPEETPDSTDDTTTDETPGFKAVFVIAGLLAIAYIRRRE